MARARQQRHKRSRDVDAELLEEFVKVTTAGEKDDEDAGDNPEHDELPQEKHFGLMKSFRRYLFDRIWKNRRNCYCFNFKLDTINM